MTAPLQQRDHRGLAELMRSKARRGTRMLDTGMDEALASAIAQGEDEAKKRLTDFLQKRGPKVARK
jgi:hypothetical protein